ncbi:hypothetical protein [Paenibacillus sp. FSL E2-0201]|uniref:hypothetical protein n=1 Tax=Paenibacillus sp. FSL E2-0201 TaxID=2954726 RepID=UPI0030DBB971
MGLVTLDNIVEGLKAIPTSKYCKPNELAALFFQAKSEYLLRDKLDLYFIDQFKENNLISLREWKTWGPWGLKLEHTAMYLLTNGWEGDVETVEKTLESMSNKKWEKLINENKIPEELRRFTWMKKGTAGIDLALFRNYSEEERKNGEGYPFKLESLIEFKCEVLHQLNPKLIDNPKYIEKDLERMKTISMKTECSYFQILCLIDFPNGVAPIYYPLNTHFENNYRNRNKYSVDKMTRKLKDKYKDFYKVTYIPKVEVGEYLGTKIELHYWIVSQ